MIRIGKPEIPASALPLPSAAAGSNGRETVERFENEVGKWIERNPVLSIGIALAIGMGMGLLLKRRK